MSYQWYNSLISDYVTEQIVVQVNYSLQLISWHFPTIFPSSCPNPSTTPPRISWVPCFFVLFSDYPTLGFLNIPFFFGAPKNLNFPRQGTESSTLCLKEHSCRPLSRWDHVPLGYYLSHRPGHGAKKWKWLREKEICLCQSFFFESLGHLFLGRIGA